MSTNTPQSGDHRPLQSTPQYFELATTSSDFYMYSHHVGDKLHNYLAQLLASESNPAQAQKIRSKMLNLISSFEDELQLLQLKHSNRLVEFLQTLPLYSHGREQISGLQAQCVEESTRLEIETANRYQREVIYETAQLTASNYQNRTKREIALKKLIEEIKTLMMQENIKRQAIELKEKQILSLIAMSQMTLNTVSPVTSSPAGASSTSSNTDGATKANSDDVSGLTSNGNANEDYAFALSRQHAASKYDLSAEDLTEIFVTLMKGSEAKEVGDLPLATSTPQSPSFRPSDPHRGAIKRKQPGALGSQNLGLIDPSDLVGESL